MKYISLSPRGDSGGAAGEHCLAGGLHANSHRDVSELCVVYNERAIERPAACHGSANEDRRVVNGRVNNCEGARGLNFGRH